MSVIEKLVRWQERTLSPWQSQIKQKSEEELKGEVERVFSLFCSLDPISTDVGVNKLMFRKFAKECRIVDAR